jgi:hypothetical protein
MNDKLISSSQLECLHQALQSIDWKVKTKLLEWLSAVAFRQLIYDSRFARAALR